MAGGRSDSAEQKARSENVPGATAKMVNETMNASEPMEDDVELAKEEVSKGAYAARLTTAAGVFLLYSYLVMNEGAVRASKFAQPEPAPFSMELQLSAAVFEVLFGLYGILVAASLLMFGKGSKIVTYSWMGVAFVFGWFTFTVFVLAANIFDIVNFPVENIPEPFNQAQLRALQTCGLLGALTWCFALQGGQFMVGNVIATIQGTGKTKGVGYAKARLIMWSVNIFVSGLAFLLAASVVRAIAGPGPYEAPVASPPIVMIYPEMTIVAGIVHMLFGLFSIYVAVSKKYFNVLAAAAVFTLLVSYTMLAWGQAWFIPVASSRIEPTTLLVGLSTMVVGNVAYSASELNKDIAMEG